MSARFGMVETHEEVGASPLGARWNATFIGAGIATLAVALGASWVTNRLLGGFHSALDSAALSQAALAFDLAIEQQRSQVTSQVAVLAGDTRVRAPMMTPTFDEATVRDVLADLKGISGATMLAVMEVGGKVRSVSGLPALRDLDLGSSPLVKSARERAGADVWSLPDRALVVGVAPIRSAEQTIGLLAIGFEIGAPLLAGIQRTVGVDGALLIGEQVVASSSTAPGLLQAFQAAAGLPDQREELIRTDRPRVARVSRTGPSAAAAKVVWMVPYRHDNEKASHLGLLAWLPAVLVAATFALLFSLARRGDTRSQSASERQRG
jgi:hypothetical protein